MFASLLAMMIFGASVSAASVAEERSELLAGPGLLGSAALISPGAFDQPAEPATSTNAGSELDQTAGATPTSESVSTLESKLAPLRSDVPVATMDLDAAIEELVDPNVSFAFQADLDPSLNQAVPEAGEPAPTTSTSTTTTSTTTTSTTSTTTTIAPTTTTVAPGEPLTGTPTQQAVQLSGQLGNPSNEADAQAAWDRGYVLGDGSNLSAFHGTILPCESGGESDRDTAVGRTDDWGRAQVNRPVWSSTFTSMFGVAFETGITQPVLNGFMAAHIEQVQGLTAWTCWRNR